MNKKIFTFSYAALMIFSLVLAACSPSEAAAQQATLSAGVEKPATPAFEIAQSAKTAAANAQSAIDTAVTPLSATLQAAATNPATPEAALAHTVSTSAASVETAVANAATALPTTLADEETPQPVSTSEPSIPVFSGLQALPSTDPKAAVLLNLASQLAKNTGFQFDGKAYVTSAKAEDVTAFYNDALKDWKATAPATTSVPTVGNLTLWVYSQNDSDKTFTISYSPYDPAANKFLVITGLLWK